MLQVSRIRFSPDLDYLLKIMIFNMQYHTQMLSVCFDEFLYYFYYLIMKNLQHRD